MRALRSTLWTAVACGALAACGQAVVVAGHRLYLRNSTGHAVSAVYCDSQGACGAPRRLQNGAVLTFPIGPLPSLSLAPLVRLTAPGHRPVCFLTPVTDDPRPYIADVTQANAMSCSGRGSR